MLDAAAKYEVSRLVQHVDCDVIRIMHDWLDLTRLLRTQVASEIEERQQFLLDARASGVPYKDERGVLAEISQRMSELKKLSPADTASLLRTRQG